MTSPLASVDDLAAWLRRPLIGSDATSAELMLEVVSELARNEARQTFDLVTDDEVRLTGGRRTLLLPERPVVSVSSVAGLYYATTADPFYYDIPDAAALYGPLAPGLWVLDAQGQLLLPQGSIWPPVVQVTYTHGYATVPNDVRAVVLSAVARRWINPLGASRTSEGGITVQFPDARSGPTAGTIGGIMLNADERRILSKYRRQVVG